MRHTAAPQQRLTQTWCKRHLFIGLSTILLVFSSFAITQAIPVAAYRKNVEQAIGALDAINVHDEHETASAYQVRFTETVNSVRTGLPAEQSVEWGDLSYTVDHAWLHQLLDELSKAEPKEQERLLARILERLGAIDERLIEIDRTAAGVVTDKGADKAKLNEILARAEYRSKADEGSALKRLVSSFVRWLSKLFGRSAPVSSNSSRLITNLSQVFVVVLALAVIGYALKTFLPKLRRTRGTKKKAKAEARVVLGERLEPDQSAVDLLSEAEALARRGEIRAAIRKAYIALLVELGERNIISLAQHKTNRDYLRAVRERESLHRKMIKLTDSFERHWYGYAQATDSDWTEFRAGYREALQE